MLCAQHCVARPTYGAERRGVREVRVGEGKPVRAAAHPADGCDDGVRAHAGEDSASGRRCHSGRPVQGCPPVARRSRRQRFSMSPQRRQPSALGRQPASVREGLFTLSVSLFYTPRNHHHAYQLHRPIPRRVYTPSETIARPVRAMCPGWPRAATRWPPRARSSAAGRGGARARSSEGRRRAAARARPRRWPWPRRARACG